MGGSHGSGGISVADVSLIFDWVANGINTVGYMPCLDALDANSDGAVGLADATYPLNYLGSPSSPAPGAPYPGCGPHPGSPRVDYASGPQTLSVRS